MFISNVYLLVFLQIFPNVDFIEFVLFDCNDRMQEKYEEATAALAEMEKRAVMAESMLKATLQYQSGQNKALSSPR